MRRKDSACVSRVGCSVPLQRTLLVGNIASAHKRFQPISKTISPCSSLAALVTQECVFSLYPEVVLSKTGRPNSCLAC